MDNKINFTKQTLDAIPFSEQRKIYKDSKERFLSLYVTKQKKAFYYDRKVKGRRYQISLGFYPDLNQYQARTRIVEINSQIASGIDPVEEKKQSKKEMAFKDLFNIYVEHNSKTKKTIAEDVKKFNKYLCSFHNLKVNTISYDKINAFHASLTKTPIQANRCLALLSSIFNFARKKLQLKIDNPCYGIQKYKENPKQRIMNTEEIAKFFATAKKWQGIPHRASIADLFLLLFFTGQRKSNVMHMKFEDIEFVSKQWTLKPSETKNADFNIVTLIKEAMEIILRRRKELKGGSVYVFPSPVKKGFPIDEPKKSWYSFLKDAKISEDLTVHDLRRTSGSLLLMNTGNLKAVQKYLGHKDIATTSKVYAHINNENMSSALQDTFDKAKKS